MRAAEFVTEISRRGFLKGAAAGAVTGAALAPIAYNALKDKEPESQPDPTSQAAPKLGLVLRSPGEKYLHDYAISRGINGIELAAFLAQCGHESADFVEFYELPPRGTKNPVRYFRYLDILYDKAKALKIGNIHPGDGYKYRGRGYVHLTGRFNYRYFGKKVGQPLEDQPDLAANPKIAAQVAVAYWKERIRPKVTDFADVRQVTRYINGELKGIDDRIRRFKEYMKGLG